MEIKRKITPYNFTEMDSKINTYIVIHYVGKVSPAKNNAYYFANNKLKSSAHYYVDENALYTDRGPQSKSQQECPQA